MDSIWHRLRFRLLPALLTAFGVALLASGLLSYTSAVEGPPVARPLASYQPLPTIDTTITLPGASIGPDVTPTFPAGRVATRIVVPRLDIDLPKDELYRLIKDLETQMKEAARALEFEKAALLRDQVIELRRTLALEEPDRIVPREFTRPVKTTRAAGGARR